MRIRARPTPAATAVLLALLCAACASVGGAGPPVALRVLVYNVHAGKDAGGAHNLERVAGVVRETRADLVLLQEVDRGTERSGGEDQLATLRRLTGLEGAFGRTLDYQGGEYGIAVLSRWPIEDAGVETLPVEPRQARAGGSYEPRGALVARIAGPATLYLLDTHLDASRDDHYRLQEAARERAIADSLGRHGTVLVGGDFNALPESAVVAAMEAGGRHDAWPGCGEGAGHTFPADAPVRRIDYLFVAPGVRCDSARVIDSEASDHRGVLFSLTLDGRPGSERRTRNQK